VTINELKNHAITFAAPYTVEIREEENVDTLEPNELLIESLYSLVSPGTELAILSGKESWARLPVVPGYCNVGTVVAVGKAVSKFSQGDVVLNYGAHRKYNRMADSGFVLKVPDGIDLKLVPLTRLATVAFTAIRVSDIELGDDVAVVGLGLVGNFAAQLARLQGGRVIGIDLSEKRTDVARACGVELTVNPSQEDATARIQELTGGAGVHSLIDATGNPKVIVANLPLIGQMGELILLGSPRGEYQSDVTDVLNYVHLFGRGSIRFKGAHEWQYPTLHDPFVKHSFERNSRIIWRLYQEGKLEFDRLITHVVKPQDAASIYEGLRTRKDEHLGCVFDWTE
jgi:2-desacetyl-2-hydroxyethyl bacteriochlorophyllide A dehydrogenase